MSNSYPLPQIMCWIARLRKTRSKILEPVIAEAPELKPEKKEMVIVSTVREVNGYIEIVRTCEDKPFDEGRQTFIKKDEITCIDRFSVNLDDYNYILFIQSDRITKRYYFERKEDVEQLYNALSKILKKKEAKPNR